MIGTSKFSLPLWIFKRTLSPTLYSSNALYNSALFLTYPTKENVIILEEKKFWVRSLNSAHFWMRYNHFFFKKKNLFKSLRFIHIYCYCNSQIIRNNWNGRQTHRFIVDCHDNITKHNVTSKSPRSRKKPNLGCKAICRNLWQ